MKEVSRLSWMKEYKISKEEEEKREDKERKCVHIVGV